MHSGDGHSPIEDDQEVPSYDEGAESRLEQFERLQIEPQQSSAINTHCSIRVRARNMGRAMIHACVFVPLS